MANTAAARPGRPRSTSKDEIERIAFDLFATRGFDATTVDDIATAAGIGRRTFFRYFESKNDVVWGDFDTHMELMRARFAQCPPDQPLMAALRDVVVDFNRFDPAEVPWHRKRMDLILTVPALQAHSTLRYAQWRQAVAAFAAQRLGVDEGMLVPRALGHAALGCALAAYEQWLSSPDADLIECLTTSMDALAAGFTTG
ncbi:mycofactocin system transcriptional regulator [Actinokineospora sp.]|uniref:mycofactocin system transcriptional regulator n=1 Tax=Actinokineospora sp. TaxID=1872133 RepID=UPI003D6B25DD